MEQIKTEKKCPIWQTPAVVSYFIGGRDSHRVDSARAGGPYVISGTNWVVLPGKNFNDQEKALLTSWLVRSRATGNMEPRIPSNIEPFVKGLRPQSVHQRADLLLKYIKSKISNIGELFEYETHHYGCDPHLNSQLCHRHAKMLAWSESLYLDELEYFLKFLQDQKWLEKSDYSSDETHRYSITIAGYSHLAELENRIPDSSQAFVAMWFDESMNDAWEKGIEPAIKETGYDAMRIDKKEHLNKIDDEIIAEIRRSKFLVADFTEGEKGTRGGVYYEAGFAHGLNIPVIFTCRKESLEKVHFDTRQYPHIVWEKPEDLRSRLAKRISAVLGDGPKERIR